MDFKSLRYPLAVAECQSISKAAEKLNISQPSLSKYLKNLSLNLNAELFETKGQNLTLTYAGKKYIYWAKKILPLTENLEKIHLDKSHTAIKIACPIGEGTYINPFAIRQFWEVYPDIKIDLHETSYPDKKIFSDNYDFAIVNHEIINENLSSQFIASDEIILITSVAHPIQSHTKWDDKYRFPRVDADLLNNETLIQAHSDYQTSRLSEQFLKEHNIKLYPMMYVDNIYQAVRIAAAGNAICFAPERLIRNHKFPENIAKYSIGASLMMNIFLVHAGNKKLSEHEKLFIKLIKSFLS